MDRRAVSSDVSTVLVGRERAPRLVLRFALLTGIGLAVAGAVIVASVRHTYTEQGERQAIDRAHLTVATMQRQLRVGDITRPLSRERRRALDRLFSRQVLGHGTTGVALYGTRGAARYTIGTVRKSTQRDRSAPLRAAVAGNVSSHVASAPTGSGRVLDTYVPVRLGGSRGVVELEQDYAPIASAARHSTLVVAAVLEGVLLALFILLLPVLARASSRIKKQVDALHQLATHDELTGLWNRVGFRRELEALVADRDRTGAIALVDVEGFRKINDALGPERGDALLIKVAERLRALDGERSLARLGEDEFGLLLLDADQAGVEAMAARVREALAQPFTVGSQRVAVEVRIGCALAPEHGTDPVVLLRRAGVALSLAKETRAHLEIYDPSHDASDVSRLTIASELREALREGQLVVHYQPQADLATHAVRGAEALVRWEHPRRGLLTAAKFIAVAEQTDLIGELGAFVLESSARQWQQWHELGLTIDIAVNLTAGDLLDPNLPEEIEALTTAHGLPPEYLVLEITERALLQDGRHAKQVLDRLERIGVRLAIDDYGTGYSSLAYLRDLPAQQVKLDRSFTAGVPGHPASEAIVRSTIELAHTLGATVVAEGVETVEQWNFLAGVGCDIAQGYLIGRPQPADELTPKLTSKRIRLAAA